MLHPQTFVVIFPHYYGKGETIAEAVKNARRAGYSNRKKAPAYVVAFEAAPDDVRVTADIAVRFGYPNDTAVMRWEEML